MNPNPLVRAWRSRLQPPPTLTIAQLGNPILRAIAEPIADPRDPALQSLIAGLMKTVRQADGVGIAAPQVSRSLRLLVIASRPNDRYPHAPVMEPTALLNPEIVDVSQERVKDWEGCLSIPGIRARVPRAKTVTVRYQDRRGREQVAVFEDFVARIFQHECDHLNGKVFLDRVEDNGDIATEQEYRSRFARA